MILSGGLLNPIEAHSLTKQFGDFLAVDSLDLSIKAGELFGFLGPNGAGKTTTLQMLSGQLPPSSGAARVLDVDTTAYPHCSKGGGGDSA